MLRKLRKSKLDLKKHEAHVVLIFIPPLQQYHQVSRQVSNKENIQDVDVQATLGIHKRWLPEQCYALRLDLDLFRATNI